MKGRLVCVLDSICDRSPAQIVSTISGLRPVRRCLVSCSLFQTPGHGDHISTRKTRSSYKVPERERDSETKQASNDSIIAASIAIRVSQCFLSLLVLILLLFEWKFAQVNSLNAHEK